MEAQFKNCTALEIGKYDFTGEDGQRYRYIVVYDADTRENVTISLDKGCVPPAIEFGTKVDLWVRVRKSDKIVRGEDRDRTFGQIKLTATDVVLAGARAKQLTEARAA